MEIALEILVDHSGSMAGKKFDRAKQILTDVAPDLLGCATWIGAKTFSGNSDMINSVYKYKLNTKDSVKLYDFISKIKDPSGGTPIAGAIRDVVKSFKSLRQLKEFVPKVVLITDGWDTSGGDWKAEIEQAKLDGIDCEIHIVGIELDEANKKLAQEAALETGGTFTAVSSVPSGYETEKLIDTFRNSVLSSKPKLLIHTLNLRADLKIEFSLPVDLTSEEADKIAKFIKILPL
ncbi:MAG: VWA domain-containing protein [Microcystis aeruginosa BS13-10]|jgi:hypothetical protein|nr:VWA domain-containing protein [Microcystis aeruginosa BS13-10]